MTTKTIRQAIGILYEMDNFVLAVMDNMYWLTMGVPDGEFDEIDRKAAENNYTEHDWLILDDAEFDKDAFIDLIDAFEEATTNKADYDHVERQKLLDEAKKLLSSIQESYDTEGNLEKCPECDTLLDDGGECPKCDHGEEHLEEKKLNEISLLGKKDTDPDAAAHAKANAEKDKFNAKLAAKAKQIVATTDISDKRASTAKFLIVDLRTGKVKQELNQTDFLKKYERNDQVRWDAVVVDADGNVMRRALEVFKPKQLIARTYAVDIVKPDFKYTWESLNGKELKSTTARKPSTSKPSKAAKPEETSSEAEFKTGTMQIDTGSPAKVQKVTLKTTSDLLKSLKLLQPKITDDNGKPINIDDIDPDNLKAYWIQVKNKEYQLDKFAAKGKQNGLLEAFKELEESVLFESLYHSEITADGDIAPIIECFMRALVEDFTTFTEIRNSFDTNKISYNQRDAFEELFTAACKGLNIDPESAVIYIDADREYDPGYFMDESKELKHNVLKVKAFDLNLVRLEFKGTIYIIFKNKADADIYMHFAR